jgi:hypothetical protein
MMNIPFRFQVGKFVGVMTRAGSYHVGCIFSLTEETLSVNWWREDMDRESRPYSYYLL